MAELSYIIKQNYKSSFDTLKHTSYDKENSVYMCQSSMKVVDFDHLTKDLYPQKQPSSYDSLIIDEETKKVFCVEFKINKNHTLKIQNYTKK
jgi:peroxiredoxin family protein